MAKLAAAQVQTLGPGRHSDGGTLTLLVSRTGGRSWVQRMMIAGRRADIGIGSASYVTLKMARAKALENRQLVWAGTDPRDAKRKAKVPTFREAAKRMMTANAASWRNGRTATDMVSQLERYVYPALASKRVDTIDRAAVLRVLVPVCTEKPETGRRVRRTIRGVLAWAMAHGHIAENPAGEAINAALPKARAAAEHHKALPYDKVSAALAAVEASSAAPAVRWVVCGAGADRVPQRRGTGRLLVRDRHRGGDVDDTGRAYEVRPAAYRTVEPRGAGDFGASADD